MRHQKKCWPEYFQAIIDGQKKFEVRLADWKCEPGDELVLQEWNPVTKIFTGREMIKKVNYVLTTKSLEEWGVWSKEVIDQHGFQIISWKD